MKLVLLGIEVIEEENPKNSKNYVRCPRVCSLTGVIEDDPVEILQMTCGYSLIQILQFGLFKEMGFI